MPVGRGGGFYGKPWWTNVVEITFKIQFLG